MARVLRMPGDAADAREGVLSSWLVDETDAFDAAQTIAYVETSTLLLSVEAGRPGVLLKTLVQPGTHVVMFANEGGKKVTSAQCKAGEQKTVVVRLPI